MQVLGAAPFAHTIQPPSQRFISLWADEERAAQRAQIKSGAANEEWNTGAAFNLFNFFSGFAGPLDRGVVDRRRNKVDQVVRYAFAFLKRDFRSCYLYFLINLNGVAVDDLAIECERNFDPERTFSRSSGTDNSNNWCLARVRTHVPEDSTRKIVIPQMSARINNPPMIWLREKCNWISLCAWKTENVFKCESQTREYWRRDPIVVP